VLTPAFHVGLDTGDAATVPNVWEKAFSYTPAPTGTKFVILHFMNVTLPGNNRLEVDLGYGTDVFTVADGGSFWTRPINVGAVGASITIRYITSGANNGGPSSIDMAAVRACRASRPCTTALPTAIRSC
jgi:hypothetical protein